MVMVLPYQGPHDEAHQRAKRRRHSLKKQKGKLHHRHMSGKPDSPPIKAYRSRLNKQIRALDAEAKAEREKELADLLGRSTPLTSLEQWSVLLIKFELDDQRDADIVDALEASPDDAALITRQQALEKDRGALIDALATFTTNHPKHEHVPDALYVRAHLLLRYAAATEPTQRAAWQALIDHPEAARYRGEAYMQLGMLVTATIYGAVRSGEIPADADVGVATKAFEGALETMTDASAKERAFNHLQAAWLKGYQGEGEAAIKHLIPLLETPPDRDIYLEAIGVFSAVIVMEAADRERALLEVFDRHMRKSPAWSWAVLSKIFDHTPAYEDDARHALAKRLLAFPPCLGGAAEALPHAVVTVIKRTEVDAVSDRRILTNAILHRAQQTTHASECLTSATARGAGQRYREAAIRVVHRLLMEEMMHVQSTKPERLEQTLTRGLGLTQALIDMAPSAGDVPAIRNTRVFMFVTKGDLDRARTEAALLKGTSFEESAQTMIDAAAGAP